MEFETIDFDDIFGDSLDVISEEIEIDNSQPEWQAEYPILPIRNTVLFPDIILPITASREQSKKLLKDAMANKEMIGVLTQIDASIDNPLPEHLYKVGTLARVIKIINMPDGLITAILKSTGKFELKSYSQQKPYFKATIKEIEEKQPKQMSPSQEALLDNIKDAALKLIEIDQNVPDVAAFGLQNMKKEDNILSFVCTNSQLSTELKQELLLEKTLAKRSEKLYKFLYNEIQKVELKNKIHEQTSSEMDKHQREYFLNQQIKTIQEELGGGVDNDVDQLKEKAEKRKWNDEVEQHFQKELKRLQRQHNSSPDYNVQRNYLDFFVELPWETYTKDIFDIPKAEKILDKAHFGLEDIKKRILEHMAVLKLKQNLKAPILCLVGPPGVGKTSLGKSIADALGRKYIRLSLGGLHDESEIRGHRKTYIGAMAGRILQSLKKAGTSNPVIVLDEMDKIGKGNNDPSSALLEVLDPEQNSNFYDNFLEMGYDLSKVMFIATANSLSTIQGPLLDRMEVIEVSGYTIEEKIEICKRHLIKKQMTENGLDAKAFTLGMAEIAHVVEAHTRESGVRGLEKRIASIARWVALQKASEKDYDKKINLETIDQILGVPMSKSLSEAPDSPGVVNGLAWTSVGGDILFIESITSQGKGQLSMTGNLGNVMKESATLALEYIKAKHQDFGIKIEDLESKNIHIHVPEGATPKDGPSAGIALLTSMVSSYTNKLVKANLAMTGEITLRGKVLPVGGIKEKLLAAVRAGIKEIILCEANRKDVEEIQKDYLKTVKIHYVNKMSEVIALAIMD